MNTGTEFERRAVAAVAFGVQFSIHEQPYPAAFAHGGNVAELSDRELAPADEPHPRPAFDFDDDVFHDRITPRIRLDVDLFDPLLAQHQPFEA